MPQRPVGLDMKLSLDMKLETIEQIITTEFFFLDPIIIYTATKRGGGGGYILYVM